MTDLELKHIKFGASWNCSKPAVMTQIICDISELQVWIMLGSFC